MPGGPFDVEPEETPPAVEVGGPVLDVAAGQGWTCALLAGGAVRCWGSDGAVQGLARGPCEARLGTGVTPPCAIGDDEHPEAAGDVPVF